MSSGNYDKIYTFWDDEAQETFDIQIPQEFLKELDKEYDKHQEILKEARQEERELQRYDRDD